MIEKIHFQGVAYTPQEFEAFEAAHPEAFLPPAPPVPTFEDLQTLKISEIQSASNAAFASIQAGYTVGEVQTFEQQRRGAADLLAGNTETEDAQYVAALATSRAAAGDEDLTALELAGRIAANAAAAAQATIAILGLQQGLEVRARNAETIADLEVIVWDMPAYS